MDKQRWLGELESLCDVLAKKNRDINHNRMHDRDRLIVFANRLVEKQLVSRREVVNLIDKVDKQIFNTG